MFWKAYGFTLFCQCCVTMFATKFLKNSYKALLKPILFRQDPEKMHDLFTQIGHYLGKYYLFKRIVSNFFSYQDPVLEQEICGILYPNPVGLAAGFDKDCQLVDIMYDIGFGFVEVGSITHKAYAGNPKPRLVRLLKDQGLIVNYGLKNKGVHQAVRTLDMRKDYRMPITVSIAKTNCIETVNIDDGIQDYISSLQVLEQSTAEHQSYTINVSCPNTFGGEPYTTPDTLDQLLSAIDKLTIKKPIFVKLPVDKTRDEFEKLLDIVVTHNVQGVVIANLTKDRKPLKQNKLEQYKGGISGKPVKDISLALIKKTKQYFGDRLIIIGVGGIFCAEDAIEKIKAGASLVQLITGMIFEGPQLIGEINRGIAKSIKSGRLKLPHSTF